MLINVENSLFEDMKKKLCICDLDGTLFDTTLVNYRSYQEALAKHSIALDFDYFLDHCYGRHYKDFLPDLVNKDMQVVKDIQQAHKSELYHQNLKYAVPNEHLFDIIKSLKSTHLLAIVTMATRKNTQEVLQNFNYLELFDLLITQEDVKNSKPDPEGFLKAMAYFECTPENTLVFEDSAVGIAAVRQTGATLFIVDKIHLP